MKRIIPLFLTLLAAFSGSANPNWRMHNTFDDDVARIIDTPDYVYFACNVIPKGRGVGDILSLFRYDKEGEELVSLSTDNILTENNVLAVEYCPQKGYLVVVYHNYDIDIIHDDGKVDNIPDYRLSSPGYSKKVNGITPDPDHNRIYLATDFGYIALNTEKLEIAESRIYGEPLQSVARMGDLMLITRDTDLYSAPASEPRMRLADYTLQKSFNKAASIYPMSATRCLVADGRVTIVPVTVSGQTLNIGSGTENTYYSIEYNRDGVLAATGRTIFQYTPDGHISSTKRSDEDNRLRIGSYDMKEFWEGTKRKGFKSARSASDGSWVTTRSFMLPDAPAPFLAPYMAMHRTDGMLILNNGNGKNYSAYDIGQPALLSSYNYGRWENLSPAYTNPSQTKSLESPYGFAIDPDNPDYVYISSRASGFVRYNLHDGNDVIHFSGPNDVAASLPGFVKVVDAQVGVNKSATSFSAPKFDSAGNMWMAYADYDNQSPERIHIFCWPAADRRATTSADNAIIPQRIEVPGLASANNEILVPLTSYSNRNILLYSETNYSSSIMVIDTNGTPLDTSDDTVRILKQPFKDQDGNDVTGHYVQYFWEDPMTGNVWVGYYEGVFYFNPRNVLAGKDNVTRIKVARNDGTDLADYLLNGVQVNAMTSDGSGRKWFATSGAGLVCTSSDGRTILQEVTTANSPIRDDVVYGVGYNSQNNSLMISTALGLCEYFLSGQASGSEETEVRAYPNPVRPDYFGYVTIDPVESGSIVKIADASGNVVKEFGPVNGNEVKWDVTNHQFRRVSSGVYYILVSSGSSEAFANVGKVVVVN